MEIREHHGYGHGLTPGTTRDLNCPSCKREDAEGHEHKYDDATGDPCVCPVLDCWWNRSALG